VSPHYEDTLTALANARDEVVVMTAENRAPIPGMARALGPRFIDVGICEQTLVGAAAGLALRGRVPVVHALAAFLVQRAFEFIRTDVGIARLPVKLVGYIPGFLSEANGPTHQAIEDVALMRSIPGMQIFCPADAVETAEALAVALDAPGPCYIRHVDREAALTHQAPFALGQAEVLSEAGEVSVLTYGLLLREAVEARRILSASGVATRLVNMRTLEPCDERVIVIAARRSRLLVTIEDHLRQGGLYSIVCEVLVRHRLARRVLPLALEGRWFRPGRLEDVLACEGFDGPSIAAAVLEAI
jgi:transketolase